MEFEVIGGYSSPLGTFLFAKTIELPFVPFPELGITIDSIKFQVQKSGPNSPSVSWYGDSGSFLVEDIDPLSLMKLGSLAEVVRWFEERGWVTTHKNEGDCAADLLARRQEAVREFRETGD